MCRSFEIGNLHFELLSFFQPLLRLITNIVPSKPEQIHLFHDYDA